MRLLCLTNDIWSQQQGEGDNSNVMKLLLCHDNQIGLYINPPDSFVDMHECMSALAVEEMEF